MSLPLNSDVYTDFSGFARLRNEAGKQSPEALHKVADQLEALFVQMMLKEMRNASLGDGIMDNDQSRLYQGMYDQQIGIEMARGKGLGLAEVLVRQLGGEQATSAGAESVSSLVPGTVTLAPPQTRPQARSQTASPLLPGVSHLRGLQAGGQGEAAASVDKPQAAAAQAWQADSPRAFVAQLMPHARRAAAELGVDPEVLVAQSALETGWGRSVMQGPDGGSSHSLFGIKADSRWDGARVSVPTLEFEDGIPVRRQAAFRAYGSVAEAFDDYAAFLKSNPRYREALQQGEDAGAFAEGLQQAGYATDPRYASKIKSILAGDTLRDALADIALGTQQPRVEG